MSKFFTFFIVLTLASCTFGSPAYAQQQQGLAGYDREEVQKQAVRTMVKFCRTAYHKFQAGDETYLKRGMERLPEDGRMLVALVCAGYGQGYEDGRAITLVSQ